MLVTQLASHSSPQFVLQPCSCPLLVLLVAERRLSSFVTKSRVLFVSISGDIRRQEFRELRQKGGREEATVKSRQAVLLVHQGSSAGYGGFT